MSLHQPLTPATPRGLFTNLHGCPLFPSRFCTRLTPTAVPLRAHLHVKNSLKHPFQPVKSPAAARGLPSHKHSPCSLTSRTLLHAPAPAVPPRQLYETPMHSLLGGELLPNDDLFTYRQP